MGNDEVRGIIDKCLFQNADTGFAVFILRIKEKESVTVRGHLPSIQPGQEVCLEGTWVFHQKFGKQFEATKSISTLPTSIVGLKKYLGSGLIKGIGPTYAERLVDHFGTHVLTVIEKNPDRLKEVAGIGEKRIERIAASWKDQKEISNIMIFLQDKGISTTYALKIYKQYGNTSIARLQENPYRLAEDIWGVGFKTADAIAHNLGIEKNSIERIRAGLVHAISTTLNNGDLYIELEQLRIITCELLEIELAEARPLIKQALHQLHEQDKIKVVAHQSRHLITLSQYYYSEKGVAGRIIGLSERPSSLPIDRDKVYEQLRSEETVHDSVQLNEDQQRGIMACMQSKISIITGGPGTGKTTLIRKLLDTLDRQKLSYKLAAPTGRAAKRIIEGTGRHALTIHRLLEFDFATMGFTHNEQNTLKLDFLIIDESSMIDIFLAHALLKALPVYAHIVFIGDIDQLPSVGAGNFLKDLIASKRATCIHLQEIFRQARNSMIIVNAHRVNHGEFPTTQLPDAQRDFFFIKEENPEKVTEHLTNIFGKSLKKFGITTAQTMVTVPMNRGIVGTQKINHDLQSLLNPEHTQKKQVTRAGSIFRENDRVMQIRNNYEKLVFNGDIGSIESINTEDSILNVSYGERTVAYEFHELDELVLAYAISIHKSQGSEFSAVIIPIFMQHFTLLQRNLIYTAITRAKKLCILIGQPKALGMALRNNKSITRTTLLTEFLTSDLTCL